MLAASRLKTRCSRSQARCPPPRLASPNPNPTPTPTPNPNPSPCNPNPNPTPTPHPNPTPTPNPNPNPNPGALPTAMPGESTAVIARRGSAAGSLTTATADPKEAERRLAEAELDGTLSKNRIAQLEVRVVVVAVAVVVVVVVVAAPRTGRLALREALGRLYNWVGSILTATILTATTLATTGRA